MEVKPLAVLSRPARELAPKIRTILIALSWFQKIGCFFMSDLIIFIADGARAKTGGHKGIRGDRRFKGRGRYPMETSYHFIHQNTKNIC